MRGLVLAVLLPALAAAESPAVVAAEVGCGYVGGAALAVAAIPVGNAFNDDEFMGAGFYAAVWTYPAGVALGAWGAGEIWGDSPTARAHSLVAAAGASYLTCVAGYGVGGWRGLFVSWLIAPAAATAAYNAVDAAASEDTIYIPVSFGF